MSPLEKDPSWTWKPGKLRVCTSPFSPVSSETGWQNYKMKSSDQQLPASLPLHERGGGLGALVVVGSDRCLETTSQGKRVGSAVKLWTEHPAGSCPVISSHLALNLFSLHQCSYPHFSQGNHCRHPKAIGILVCEKLPRKTWKSQPITWVIHLKT